MFCSDRFIIDGEHLDVVRVAAKYLPDLLAPRAQQQRGPGNLAGCGSQCR